MKFKQFAKRSARVLPADLWTGHAHYVKNHRSTVKHGSRRRDCFSPGFSLLYFGNSQIYWSYVAFQIVCGFLFSAKQFPSAEFGICNIKLRIADKNRRRVELSSSVLLQTLGKLKSLQGTELSVVVVICLLGSFWILTLDSRCWLIEINEVKCYEVLIFIQLYVDQ